MGRGAFLIFMFLLSAFIPGACWCAAAEQGDPVIAVINGRPIHASDVEPRAAMKLYRLRGNIYLILKKEARRVAEEMLLQEEAKNRGITVEELLRREVDEKVAPVGEEEVERHLQEHYGKGWDTDRGRALVRAFLERQSRDSRKEELLRSLWGKAHYRLLLEKPERPRCRVGVEGQPSMGPADAPVTVVHFGSLTDRLSRTAVGMIRKLMKRFPGEIRWVHRDLLRIQDGLALKAALLGEAAYRQGVYWRFHDAVVSREQGLTADVLAELARKSGVDLASYDAMGRKGELLGEVRRDLAAAMELGISPPSVIFVNGFYFHPTFAYEDLEGMVREQLKGGSQGKTASEKGPFHTTGGVKR